MRKITEKQLRYYLGFILMLIFWLFLIGCDKSEITKDINVSGAFTLPSMEFGDTDYLEIDIEGVVYTSKVEYVPHGIRSIDKINIPVHSEWMEVTRIEFFNDKGVKTNYVKSIENLGDYNGLVIMGVPFIFKGEKISCQIFSTEY